MRADTFDAFADAHRPAFGRADQFRRFGLYLRGLLAAPARRTVEGIAAAVGPEAGEQDLAQALQHFVSHSPWAADRLLAVHRGVIATQLHDPTAVWVVHEAAFPKKGRHSVGVYRQLARPLGRKLNCQVAVVVSQVGPAGYFPLAARLYLPAGWLRDEPALGAGVPEAVRQPATKAEIALDLIDGLLADGWRPAGVVGLSDGLGGRGLTAVDDEPARGGVEAGFVGLSDRLGLTHFEGRTWLGWHHHVALAFTAFGYLATRDRTPLPVSARSTF